MSTNALFRFRDFSWGVVGALKRLISHRQVEAPPDPQVMVWIVERIRLRYHLRSTRKRHVRELEAALEQWINETSDCGYPPCEDPRDEKPGL